MTKKPKKGDDDDKLTRTPKSKSKATKENKIQELTQFVEEAQKGMLDMATELRELRGLPEAIQKQFEEQQKAAAGKCSENLGRAADDDVSMESLTRV